MDEVSGFYGISVSSVVPLGVSERSRPVERGNHGSMFHPPRPPDLGDEPGGVSRIRRTEDDAAGGREPRPAADLPGDPAAWLRRLKDRDAECDNRSVEADRLWVERVSPRGQVAAGSSMRASAVATPERPRSSRSPTTSTSRTGCGKS